MNFSFSGLTSRLKEGDVKKLLAKREALVLNSHFVYSKPEGHGDHGSAYVNKDALYADSECVAKLCLEMAWRLRDYRIDREVECVVGPAMGGIILSNQVALLHGQLQRTRLPGSSVPISAFAEKKPGGGFELRRGYDQLIAGKKVLVVEDILNSGGSASEAVAAVRAAGGDPLAVFAICNRGGVTAQKVGVPLLDSLVSFVFDKYSEKECPLCAQGIAVRTDLGHGKAFMARKMAELERASKE